MTDDKFKDLSAYCMFLGYPRSGHSLVGSLLNAHPEIVMAHELDALSLIDKGITRYQLFQKILDADQTFVQSGAQWKEYNYKVPEQWQGKYRKLRIIGDKKGGRSALILQNNKSLLNKLASTVDLPIYIIHVVRNPFDNIATMSKKNFLSLPQSVDMHLKRCRFIWNFNRQHEDINFLTVHHEKIIASPENEIKRLCEFLNVEAGDSYIKDCSSIVFKGPSKTRATVDWNKDLIMRVQKAIQEIPFLSEYDFDE